MTLGRRGQASGLEWWVLLMSQRDSKGFGPGQVGICSTVLLIFLEVSLWWGGFVTDPQLGAMDTALDILAGSRRRRT